MNRRNFFSKTFAAGLASFISVRSLKALTREEQDHYGQYALMDSSDIIPAPGDPLRWPEWRKDLTRWRENKHRQLNYDGSSYRSEPFKWVTSDFACCFIMMCDSDFYDYEKHEYTISKLIEKGILQYGGYESVVLWHAYPRIGLDDRNQFDFYREMPDGLNGLLGVVKQFNRSRIKVFINYNPWDTGNRREKKPDIDALIEIIKSIDADGIFLDTMKDAPGFREKLDKVRPGIVMEGEIALPLEHIRSHHMSWAQWFRDSSAPGVYRNKWFEHCHMQHAIDRWNDDKTAQLHTAWMNGSGMMIWENIFGQWLGWNERDKSIYRAMHSIQNHFADIFSGNGWTPLSNESPITGVYISSWGDNNIQIWTLVNRNEFPAEGILMKTRFYRQRHYYDIVSGEEVIGEVENGYISHKARIGNRGISCFLSINENKVNDDFLSFLASQKELAQLASEDTTVPTTKNQLLRKKETKKYHASMKGMVIIPSANISMKMEYTFRESGGYENIQEHIRLSRTHKLHSPCLISRNADIRSFAIDETPVTNFQYKEFIESSGYIPRSGKNFLKHWTNGQIPHGKEDHPVVYVDLEDARAYAGWTGKRLPSEEEWQFAAQGPEAFNYPWGNEMENNKCNQYTNGETTAVKAYPEGISPFGCYDMCGNTWELTGGEYSDGRTRFVMLKGGSCYKANGSDWYTDGGPQKNYFISKMLMMWSGLDRCSTIGFRCVADL